MLAEQMDSARSILSIPVIVIVPTEPQLKVNSFQEGEEIPNE
jgi:hypothetical protein